MPGKVIGEFLNCGYAGTPSRMSDCVIAPYAYAAANTGNIAYGEPVAYDAANNGVRKLTSTDTAAAIVGFAVRKIGQPKSDDNEGWYYAPGEVVDVLLRGSMSVSVLSGTYTARGQVYACNGKYAARAAGSITGTNDTTNNDTLAVPGAVFTTGYVDDNGVAEITLTSRIV